MARQQKKEIKKYVQKHFPSSETQRVFLNCKSDLIIYGGGAGSGKSYQGLMFSLPYINDPNFRAIYFRQTYSQLKLAGGLWENAQEMYGQYGAIFNQPPTAKASFPSGAMIQFGVLANDADKKKLDGGQFSLVVFDEGQWHTSDQLIYLMSRIRSNAKAPHQMVITCNPLNGHRFLTPLVEPYLDPMTGIPTDESFAVERWFILQNGEVITAATKEELLVLYPNAKPKTYTFIRATIYDNPLMIKNNPGYLEFLENQTRTERERLLLGSWYAKPLSAGYFKREMVHLIDRVPEKVLSRCIAWDIAISIPSETNPHPDWTAAVLMSKTHTGYVVEDVIRFQARVHDVIQKIAEVTLNYYNLYGEVFPCIIPEDPAAGGGLAAMFTSKTLIEQGIDVKIEKIGSKSNKLEKMKPFLALAGNGLVQVVKSDEWNDAYFNELEDFVFGNKRQKDDQWDATASACKWLLRKVEIPTMSIPSLPQDSIIAKI